MTEAFMKSLKWYFLTLALILGSTCLMISQETGSVRPIIVAVFGYGTAYVMASFWKDFRGRLLFVSLLVFLMISIISAYMPMILYVLFNIDAEINKYLLWALCTGGLGVPIMTLVFRKYD